MSKNKYILYRGHNASLYIGEPTKSKYAPIYFGLNGEALMVPCQMEDRYYTISMLPHESDFKYIYGGQQRDIRFIGKCYRTGRYVCNDKGYGEYWTLFDIISYPEQVWSIRTWEVQKWLRMTEKRRKAVIHGSQVLTGDVIIRPIDWRVTEEEMKAKTYEELNLRRMPTPKEARERLMRELLEDDEED